MADTGRFESSPSRGVSGWMNHVISDTEQQANPDICSICGSERHNNDECPMDGNEHRALFKFCERCIEYGHNDEECFFGTSPARNEQTTSTVGAETPEVDVCSICSVYRPFEFTTKECCWQERFTKGKLPTNKVGTSSGRRTAMRNEEKEKGEENAKSSESEAQTTSSGRSISSKEEEEIQEAQPDRRSEEPELEDQGQAEERSQEKIEMCIQMIKRLEPSCCTSTTTKRKYADKYAQS